MTRLVHLETALGASPLREVHVQVEYHDSLTRSVAAGPHYVYWVPAQQLRPQWWQRGGDNERP